MNLLRILILFCIIMGCSQDIEHTFDDAKNCSGKNCDITCNPEDTFLAMAASWSGIPNLIHSGDAEPATPEEVGDGKYHLFIGVGNLVINPPEAEVRIYDATSSHATGPYIMPAEPIINTVDSYDQYGIETPSYFRADKSTEYIYYCGLYSSYATDPLAWISALKRVDGGPWTKLGRIAPSGTDEYSQCEPDVARDPISGKIVLFFLNGTEDSNGVKSFRLVARTSDDPENFPAENETVIIKDDGFVFSKNPDIPLGLPGRPSISLDPYSNIWRFSFDVNYMYPKYTMQSWSPTIIPERSQIESSGDILHSGYHDIHLNLHLDKNDSNAPKAAVTSPSSAIYPTSDKIIFFYGGIGTSDELRVNGQICYRNE